MSRSISLVLLIGLLALMYAPAAADDVKGLTGRYYDNFTRPDDIITFDEVDLVMTRIDTMIAFWNPVDCYYTWNGVPQSGNWYGVRWEGYLYIDEAGDYGFGTISDDGSQLWLDGDLIVNNGEEQWYDWEDCLFEGSYTGLYPENYGPPDTLCGPITLAEGLHSIDLRFYEARNFDGIELWWLPPGSGESDIPYHGVHCGSGLSINAQTNWEIIPPEHLLPAPVAVPEGAPAAAAVFHPATPNPFNPSTKLSFTLPRASAVDLGMYSIDGRRLATVYRGQTEAGRSEFHWKGTDSRGRPLPSGIYLARLRLDDAVHSQRLTLLK